jgi:hypothetical protein
VTFDQATEALIALAQEHDGVLTAELIEQNERLSAEQGIVAAAARALDGTTNVFGTPRDPKGGWFPFAELRFTGFPGAEPD